MLILQALLFEKLEGPIVALKPLQEAVSLAEHGQQLRPFVEAAPALRPLLEQLSSEADGDAFLTSILSACNELKSGGNETQSSRRHSQSTDRPSVQPLTNRELDVLELLAKRLYDKEIAERLSISPETVRTHVKHIYGKLQVGGRREAASKAKLLGLV